MSKGGDSRLTGNPGGSRSSADQPRATSENTADYQVVEQNTDRVDIVALRNVTENMLHFNKMTDGENINTLKRFLMSGKKFSDAIKLARGSGKMFIKYNGILINIQLDTD